MAALYHSTTFDPEKQALGTLYERIGEAIATNDMADLKGMYAVMDFKSPITEILDRLE